MPKNETTPGRGYPLPVLENKLDIDCQKLRSALFAIDEDYLKLVLQMKAFLDRADEYLKEIDDGFANIDERQESFDEEKAAQIRAMRDEVAGYLAKLGEDADACFGELDRRVDGTLEELRSDVAAEILRMTSRIPHYGEISGTILTAGSRLPAGGCSPLEYVEGLGFFRFDPGAADPPDGETCILPAEGEGRWLLVLPSLDVLLYHAELVLDAVAREQGEEKAHFLSGSAALSFGTIQPAASGDPVERSLSIPGATAGDGVVVIPPSGLAIGVVYAGYVASGGVVTIRCGNCSRYAVTPAAATWSVLVIRRDGLV